MKKGFALVVSLLMLLGLLAGCTGEVSSASVPSSSATVSSVSPAGSEPQTEVEPVTMRIAGLKGPTTMGMVKLMSETDAGQARHDYQFTMYGAADEVTTKLISGEIDIAALPANVASVLYNKTEGQVQVAAINTLGVLYVVETGDAIDSIEDLVGKTVYTTGKGQTPELVINYILEQNGIDPLADLTLEYKSEATEVAAMLAATEDAVAILPQPYVTAAQMQNENIRVALSLTEEWDKVSQDSSLVTGVLVVRREFAQQNPEAFAQFLQDYKASIDWVNANTQDAAQLVADYGIVEKAPVAEKALPQCGIVYIDGNEMQTMLGGYLEVLAGQQPEIIGGALPEADFYYGA